MTLFRRCFCILLAALAAGCATTDTPVKTFSESERTARWEQQQNVNSSVTSWELKGKIGVITGGKGGSATLRWSYVEDDQKIELYGPFGGGRVKIVSDSESAVLRDNKGVVIEGKNAEEVLYQRLGWQVPFAELVMWSRGLPNEGATDIEIDESGRLASLNQGIWHVEYQEYRAVDDLSLPRKLLITSIPGALELYDDDGKYLGDELKVKVILKRWWDITSS